MAFEIIFIINPPSEIKIRYYGMFNNIYLLFLGRSKLASVPTGAAVAAPAGAGAAAPAASEEKGLFI